MSTFIDWAVKEEESIVLKVTGLLVEVRDGKSAVKDPAAMQILTALQASLLCLRTQAGDALALLKSANRNNELAHVPAPQPDRRMLAAHDDTFEFSEPLDRP